MYTYSTEEKFKSLFLAFALASAGLVERVLSQWSLLLRDCVWK